MVCCTIPGIIKRRAAGNYITAGVHDITITALAFKNGVKGHIFVSWLHPYKEQKLIVAGSKAMAVFDDLTEDKLFMYPHGIAWINGKIPVAQKAQFYPVQIEKKEPLREELRHFIECIETRVKPKTDGWEGLRVLKVLEPVIITAPQLAAPDILFDQLLCLRIRLDQYG